MKDNDFDKSATSVRFDVGYQAMAYTDCGHVAVSGEGGFWLPCQTCKQLLEEQDVKISLPLSTPKRMFHTCPHCGYCPTCGRANYPQ